MITTLYYSPGQTASIFLETTNSSGIRTDSATLPDITSVILPSGLPDVGYPKPMTKLSTGVYLLTLPLVAGAAGVGSYLVDATYTSPVTSQITIATYQIIAQPQGGFFSAIS
jgi:hypothetical protein